MCQVPRNKRGLKGFISSCFKVLFSPPLMTPAGPALSSWPADAVTLIFRIPIVFSTVQFARAPTGAVSASSATAHTALIATHCLSRFSHDHKGKCDEDEKQIFRYHYCILAGL
uniref:Uncharacterized protein n=1 Tax=Rhipicephalus zambeziensis TaxID=60191 RepID=A0A224YEV3_9ACAR